MGVMKSARPRQRTARKPARGASFAGAPSGLPLFLRRGSHSDAPQEQRSRWPGPPSRQLNAPPDAEQEHAASPATSPATKARAEQGEAPASRFLSASGASLDATWAARYDRPRCCAELDDARAFSRGSYGALDSTGAGGLGGFTAWYFPFGGDGVLHIVESGAVAFKDLLVSAGGAITPHPDLPPTTGLTALAARVQGLPAARRVAALADYQWSAAERATWLGELEQTVEEAWGWQHSFFLNRPCWTWLGADVNVDVRLHTGPKSATDHLDVETYKTPQGESLRSFEVSHRLSPGSGTDSNDQRLRLASTTTGEKEYDLLRRSVEFAHDSDVLSASAQTALRGFIDRYDGASSHPAWSRARIELIGRTSSSGSEQYNQDLSERRAEAVRAFLAGNGLSDAPIRVRTEARGELDADQTADVASDRRVDLVVDGGARMVTAVHEFGHVFGLGDEYENDRQSIGDDAEHHGLARNMTDSAGRNLPGAAVEHTGGIMSFGTEVRPQHYATFHDALERVTNQRPWSLGNRTDLSSTEATCSGAVVPPCRAGRCLAENAQPGTGASPTTSDA